MTTKSESNALEIPGGEVVAISYKASAIMVPMTCGRGYILITGPDSDQPPLASDTLVDVMIYKRNEWACRVLRGAPLAKVLAELPEWVGTASEAQVELTLMTTLLRALQLAHEGYASRVLDANLPQPDGAYAYEALEVRRAAERLESGAVEMHIHQPPARMHIPGGEIIGMGDNCEAISVPLPGNRYMAVTSVEDGGYPPSVGDEFVDVGIYPNGESYPLELHEAVPTSELFTRLAELATKQTSVDG